MLSKLLKYEFMATSRFALPLMAVCLLSAGVTRLLLMLDSTIVMGLMLTLSLLIIVAELVVIIIMMIQRFYKNLLGDEGYLMFTLPTDAHRLILSKLISAFVWVLGAVLCMLASLAIIFLIGTPFASFDPWDAIKGLIGLLSQAGPAYIALTVIDLLIFILTAMTMFYVSMALGSVMGRNRVLLSFVAYFMIYMITEAIMGGAILFVLFALPGLAAWFGENMISLFVIMGLWYLAQAAVYYAVTHRVLSRRLNLE